MADRPQFDKRGYSLSPQNVSDVFWYYEDKKGLCCIFQPRDAKGKLLLAWPAWHIPWKLLDRTFERRRNFLAKQRAKRLPKMR
jgi:hypothetical protein